MERPPSENQRLKTEGFRHFQTVVIFACALWAMANCVPARAATARLDWDALADPSVVAYSVHYGGASGHYTNSIFVGGSTSVVVSNLVEGATYYFVLTSFDNNGFESVYSSEVAWHVPLPVTITENGTGTVIVNETPASSASRRTFTLTATPGTGMIFAGWTGDLVSSAASFTFVWTSNVVLQANFISNPYPTVQGTYNGLFAQSDHSQVLSSGAFSVTVGPRGAYSGRLQLTTNRFAFSGHLDAQCGATAVVARTNMAPFDLNFTLGTGSSTGQISGTLSDGSWTSNLSGERAIYDGTNNPAPFAGNYTMVIPGVDGDPSLPAGNGFGAVYVYRSGLVACSVTLGDGAKSVQSATVSSSKVWPLYTPLYNGNGSLSGWTAFQNTPQRARPAELTWIRPPNPAAHYYPAGFTNQFAVEVSSYSSPSATTGKLLTFANPTLSFVGGNLAAEFTNSLRIGPYGGNLNLSSNYLSLTFSLANGTFKGTVVDPSSRASLPFSGAILQNRNLGAGLLIGNSLSSGVILSP
jgi:hypothetical protein